MRKKKVVEVQTPKTKEELRSLVIKRVTEEGPKCDLNDIDVNKITDMSYMFMGLNLNGDISKWDVSNVRTMSYMFLDSQFTGDLSMWDTSNVKDMNDMFYLSPLSGREPDWWRARLK